MAVRNSLLERFPGKFRRCWKILPRFSGSTIPAKAWAFSDKENGCWKIGRAFGNAAGFSPPRPPQPFGVLLIVMATPTRNKKTALLDNSPLDPPRPTPLKNANLIFIVSPSLRFLDCRRNRKEFPKNLFKAIF